VPYHSLCMTFTWRCTCGQTYRVTGLDRHRVYWPEGGGPRDVAIDGCCVNCGRPLPDKQPHCQE
jgi:hypothetical protein